MKTLTTYAKHILRRQETNRRALVDLKIKHRSVVLNSGLCDDIIHRLRPSLERHRGCDIIDINPGIGLWSAKLHEAVQPRRHLLVEPAFSLGYKPFLQPLLDAPDSKFNLVQWEGEVDKRSPARYLKEGLLPDQKGLDDDSLKVGGCNNSLLFVVNFLGFGLSGKKPNREHTEMWMDNWLKAAHAEDGFHRNGFVRLLALMGNAEKYLFVPRTPTDRHALTFKSDLLCHVEEIAGAAADEGRHRRSSEIEFLSSAAALNRMEEAGVETKLDRLDQVPRDIIQAKQDDPSLDVQAAIPSLAAQRFHRHPWHIELQRLEEDYANGNIHRPESALDTDLRDDSKGATSWRRMAFLQRNQRNQRKWDGKIEELVREFQAMDHEDAAIRADPALTEGERGQKLAAIDAQAQAFRDEKVDKLPYNRVNMLASLGDMILAWEAEPKLLAWDRRRAEPLLCHATDFHPINTMTLLDFQLRDDDDDDDDDGAAIRLATTPQRYLELMLWFIGFKSSDTVRTLLERMQFGAADALLPRCPTLRDPRRGGRRDPGSVTSRSLSRRMLVELAHAWEEWAFALSPTKMLGGTMAESLRRGKEEWKAVRQMLGGKERIRPREEEEEEG